MKITNEIPDLEPTPIVAELPAKTESLIRSIRPQKGQKLFFVDTKELKVREVVASDYAINQVDFKTKDVKKKLIIPPHVEVVVALNFKNVYKKLSKAFR